MSTQDPTPLSPCDHDVLRTQAESILLSLGVDPGFTLTMHGSSALITKGEKIQKGEEESSEKVLHMYGIPTETPRADQGSNDFVPDLIGSRNFEVPLSDMDDPDNEQVSSDALKVSERNKFVSAENFHSKNHYNRKRKPYDSKVRGKLLKPESRRKIFRRNLVLSLSSTEMKKMKCCQQNCFSRTDCVFLSSETSRVLLWGNEDRRRYLQNLLEPSSMIFRFAGRKVCYKFLESSFKFSRHLQSSVKKSYSNGRSFCSIQTSKHLASPSRDAVICFLERFAESTADRMPDTNERHLPLFQKKLSMKCSVNSTLFCMVHKTHLL